MGKCRFFNTCGFLLYIHYLLYMFPYPACPVDYIINFGNNKFCKNRIGIINFSVLHVTCLKKQNISSNQNVNRRILQGIQTCSIVQTSFCWCSCRSALILTHSHESKEARKMVSTCTTKGKTHTRLKVTTDNSLGHKSNQFASILYF